MNSRPLSILALTACMAASAVADPLYGLYSNIRTYSYGGGQAADTHQYLGYSPVSTLSGSSSAAVYGADGSFGEAVGTTFLTYGYLHVDQHGDSANTTNNAGLAVVTNDGNPQVAFYDRLYLNGADVGASVTVSVSAWLSDVTRISGNHVPSWNVPQGLNGYVGVAGQAYVPVQDYNASSDVHVTGPQNFTVIGIVGSFLDIYAGMYADLDTIDTFNGNPQSAHAVTIGTLNTTFVSDDPLVSISSASGHDYRYAATPEPSTWLALGLGCTVLLRRRRR